MSTVVRIQDDIVLIKLGLLGEQGATGAWGTDREIRAGLFKP